MMIVIYKTPTCAYCSQTTAYLSRKNAPYIVKDVTLHHVPEYEALANTYGFSVPLVTDGKTGFTGWNLAKLNQMLEGVKY